MSPRGDHFLSRSIEPLLELLGPNVSCLPQSHCTIPLPLRHPLCCINHILHLQQYKCHSQYSTPYTIVKYLADSLRFYMQIEYWRVAKIERREGTRMYTPAGKYLKLKEEKEQGCTHMFPKHLMLGSLFPKLAPAPSSPYLSSSLNPPLSLFSTREN